MPSLRSQLPIDVARASYQGNRKYQEDSFYTSPVEPGKPWLGIVSDGMGGHEGGDIASQTAVAVISGAFFKLIGVRGASIGDALRRSVEAGHQAVLIRANELKVNGNMGATVVAFAVHGNLLYWCSAGDSRLYILREGRLKQVTKDFTLGADLESALTAGHISRQEFNANPQKGALTSFLGTDALRLDEGSMRLIDGDWLLACTDGVYGTIGAQAIPQAVQSTFDAGAPSAEKAIDCLFNDFLFPMQSAHQDNATAIVVRIGTRIQEHGSRRQSKILTSPIFIGAASIGLVVIGVALRSPLEQLWTHLFPQQPAPVMAANTTPVPKPSQQAWPEKEQSLPAPTEPIIQPPKQASPPLSQEPKKEKTLPQASTKPTQGIVKKEKQGSTTSYTYVRQVNMQELETSTAKIRQLAEDAVARQDPESVHIAHNLVAEQIEALKSWQPYASGSQIGEIRKLEKELEALKVRLFAAATNALATQKTPPASDAPLKNGSTPPVPATTNSAVPVSSSNSPGSLPNDAKPENQRSATNPSQSTSSIAKPLPTIILTNGGGEARTDKSKPLGASESPPPPAVAN